jgi:hypothetical protein
MALPPGLDAGEPAPLQSVADQPGQPGQH